tara:strand:+ start:6900 stop:7838 length:939 start_codon:yes stop_codon:yes gene_type:complete
MAVRAPLYYDGGDLKEMTSAEVDEYIAQTIYQYSLNPSVILSVVATGGNLGTITDTRQTAGAMSSDASAFPSEATTDEPGSVTISYDRLSLSSGTTTAPSDSGKTYMCYKRSDDDIQAMTLQDFKDTFVFPAANLISGAGTTSQQAGTYHISTSTSVSGSTLVSSTPIFLNTQADTAAYTSGGIPETLDQPTTINSYYLQRIDGVNNAPSRTPLYITGGNHLQEYSTTNLNTLLQDAIRYEVHQGGNGYNISYNLGTTGSGVTRGSGIADTILTGTGNYQTRFVGTNDYRAQEFPNGSPTTANTYYLRISKS